MHKRTIVFISVGALLLLAAAGQRAMQSFRPASSAMGESVRTPVVDTAGRMLGMAVFTQERSGVRIELNVKGLPPGAHGFHIHETGRCDIPDFKTAGAHFNPTGKRHGLHNPEGPHAGDLPNLNVASDGTASTVWLAKGVTLKQGQPNSLRKQGGTAIVIHELPDDGKTDPAGNSGARIACGVIR
jgi:Cu-Zn family superoxide dismutase